MSKQDKNLRAVLGLSRQNLVLWATSLGHAYTHWFPATFYLLLPLVKDELGLSYTEMGLLITVRYIVSTVANFPSGMLVDLVGRRNLIMAVALAWVGIPYLLVGISASYALLILCMAIIGAGNNLWHPAAIPTLRDAYPAKRGWAMGWHASAANLGDALGPFISGILLAWLTWRHILVASAVPGLLIGLLIWWMLESAARTPAGAPDKEERKPKPVEAKPPSPGQYLRGLGKLFFNPNVFFLCMTTGIRSLTQNGLSTFLPSFFMNLLHLSPWLSGVYMTIIQIAGIVAAPISGRVSDKSGRKRVVTAGLSFTSLAIFLLALLNIPWLFVAFLGVLGFFLYSLRPVLIAWTMEVAPQEYGGSVVGLQFSFQSALSALAPVLGGWIADTWGLMYTFYFLAGTVLLANLFVFFVPESASLEVAEARSA